MRNLISFADGTLACEGVEVENELLHRDERDLSYYVKNLHEQIEKYEAFGNSDYARYEVENEHMYRTAKDVYEVLQELSIYLTNTPKIKRDFIQNKLSEVLHTLENDFDC